MRGPNGCRPVVLVTGSAGLIGGIVGRHLGERYELRGIDRRPGADMPGTVGDIADVDVVAAACAGVDAVVHLAATPDVEASWAEVLESNIVGTFGVFEGARRAGVGRVVFASSNHVVGQYEADWAPALYELDDPRRVTIGAETRPDSLYGVSKVFGEALGRLYADRHGMRVVCLRLGSVLPEDDPWAASRRIAGAPIAHPPIARPPIARPPAAPGTAEELFRRYRATWLSHRDCASLIAAALEADVRWAVAYGVSDNPRRFWELESARRLLAWEPLDRAPKAPPDPVGG
jgi:nucleoside-diphosphate-sugar epimerase